MTESPRPRREPSTRFAESSAAWTRLDRIRVTGIRAFGYHGVFPEERRDGQEFRADVTLWVDTRAAADSDDVAHTVHYGEVSEAVAGVLSGDPVNLVERLAQRIADAVLAFAGVQCVEVTVHKPDAPITVPFDDVTITIVRGAAMSRRLAQGYEPAGPWVDAVVALGANLGERSDTIDAAVTDLRALSLVASVRVAPVIESVAVKLDGPDEDAPVYLNTVAIVRTRLAPTVLLAHLNRIEAEHGRVRRERWGDRTLDLDLIAYGDVRSDDPRLTLPHPRAAERTFVLDPWLVLDADAVLPGRGPVAELRAALGEAA